MKKKGQILLITVMVLATIMTIVLSVSFQSITETQVSKLEEDSQKALAAAEAAVEASLKEGSSVVIGEGSLSDLTGFTGGATIESLTDNVFTSPTIAKDSSYTFYLGEYDSSTNTIGPSLSEGVTVCFDAATTNPAIEITVIKSTSVRKYVVDPNTPKRISNGSNSGGICPADGNYDFSYTVPAVDIGVDSKLMIVRVFYSSTKVIFSRGSDFPIQGKTVSSEAATSTGVSKKIVLFQSNPQIPADFFTTAF
jgi:type II secretory pathway pseudopilin PulG